MYIVGMKLQVHRGYMGHKTYHSSIACSSVMSQHNLSIVNSVPRCLDARNSKPGKPVSCLGRLNRQHSDIFGHRSQASKEVWMSQDYVKIIQDRFF